MRIWRTVLAGVFASMVLTTAAVAAETQSNDNHTDTDDYCLRAHDVTMGLAELQSMGGEAEIQASILEAAQIAVYIRDNDQPGDTWTQLTPAELSFDFSGFSTGGESLGGGAVMVSAPAISLATPSTVSFAVSVINNLPQPKLVNIHFAETSIPDMTLDVSDGNLTLTLADLPLPEKEGYSFDGWYLDEVLSQPWLLTTGEEPLSQSVTGDMTVYPKFSALTEPTPPPTEPTAPPPVEPTPTPPVVPTPPPPAEPTPPPQVVQTKPSTTAAPMLVPMELKTPAPMATQEAAPSGKPIRKSAVVTGTDRKQENMMMQPIAQHSAAAPGVFFAVCLVVVLVLANTFLYGSVFSDLRVLRWYQQKKMAWRAQL